MKARKPWWERNGGTFALVEDDLDELSADASTLYAACRAWAERGNCAFIRTANDADCHCDWHMATAAVAVAERRK